MKLNNVTRYYPEEMPYGEGVQYFQSEDGEDFYEALNKFTLKYKLLTDANGIIRSVSEDASTLYPAGFSVVETDSLPDGFDISGDWMFEDGVVKAVPVDYLARAESERQSLLTEAKDTISIWQTQLSLGSITDANKAKLVEWLTYIDELNALDLSNIVDEDSYNAIVWPDAPDTTS